MELAMTQGTSEDEMMVLVETDAVGVATVTLNRPERNNAWMPALEADYFATLSALDDDPSVRVVVVTGAGKSFCPGVDVGRLDGLVGKPMDLSGRISPTSAVGMRKPVIAAINGACAGMGLVQALMCDIRFAARGARFATSFARRGLAAEYGISYLLPRLIGTERSLDLLLSGRTFDADEALALGVVSRVVDPDDLVAAAQDYARDLALKSSPISMAFVKHQVWTALDQNLDDGMRSAYLSMRAAMSGGDFREGLDSFLEKREPRFPGLIDSVRPERTTGVDVQSAFSTLGRFGVSDSE
jgi:enoyl-CoA hydratase/carnithine racemase